MGIGVIYHDEYVDCFLFMCFLLPCCSSEDCFVRLGFVYLRRGSTGFGIGPGGRIGRGERMWRL